MGPHPPFVFYADGSPAPPPPCYPDCGIFEGQRVRLGWSHDEYGLRLVGQLRYVNELVLAAVDQVIAHDPEAAIVVMSDHGSRFDVSNSAEQFRNLIVARTPGHPSLIGPEPTLVNIFPSILNAYMDADLAHLADTRYEGGHGPWLAVEELPH
jgi:hypothetical protein